MRIGGFGHVSVGADHADAVDYSVEVRAFFSIHGSLLGCVDQTEDDSVTRTDMVVALCNTGLPRQANPADDCHCEKECLLSDESRRLSSGNTTSYITVHDKVNMKSIEEEIKLYVPDMVG